VGRADAASPKASQLKHPISPRAALVAFAIAMIVLAQGITAPFVKDAEPQAASWIQDVASGNDILIPHDYYGELARKPPLFYWAAGAIAAATGGHVNEFRARIVSVFAGAAIAVGVLIWTAAYLDLTSGWLAFLFLLGSYAFTSRGTLALEDMMLVAFMFGAWCLLYATIEEGPSRRKTVAMGVALGLGVLTKGPVAIVLPAFGAMIYLLMTRRSIVEQLRQSWPWMMLALTVAIALTWYIPALMRHGGELARIMFQENAGHFLPAGAGGTGEAARPFYFIGVKMIGGITPLNFLLPALILALIRGDFIAAARRPLMFQLSFLIAMLIFFSVASAKRDDYVLPGIPSLAILLAALFTSLQDAQLTERLRDLAAIAVTAIAILCVATASMWIYVQHSSLLDEINPLDRAQTDLLVKYYIGALSLAVVAVGLVVIGCAVLDVIGVRRKHPTETAAGLGCLSLLGVLLFTASIRPEMARERTLKYAAADINRIEPNAPVYVINENEELSFYLGREAPQIIGGERTLQKIELPAYLFAYRSDFRGPGALLKDRLTLVQQWDRFGRAGSPALYQLQQGLKPPVSQGK
jgi:4-amino-4-deoxy-L-arabinose transferase-like glycosyltransferase